MATLNVEFPKRKRKPQASKYDYISPDTLRLLKQTMTVEQIGMHLDIPTGSVSGLLKKHGIVSGKGQYDREPFKKPKPPKKKRAKPATVAISPEQERFIRQHYARMPRQEIARRLGIGKVTLNMMIEQLGLGASG